MTTTPIQIRIFSEDGDPQYANEMTIEVDTTRPACPIILYLEGMPAFSLGSYEVEHFCKALSSLVS
jgi:hypothetical protein